MAAEIINEIKKAEQQAKEIVVQANKDSKDMISKATNKAETIYKEILLVAKNESNDIINAQIASGNTEAEKLFEQGKRDCETIASPSQTRVDEAVKLVIERIVNIHGNS